MCSIWAVASNTLKQTIRMKIALIFTVMLLVLLPVMGIAMTGDGTIKGRLQTFVSYGLSLTSFLLCLLTIFATAYTITADIKGKQIYTVVTKPIRRWQLLLGKLSGIILLNIFMLTLFSGIIFGITRYMPHYFNTPADQLTQLDNEFYTARTSIKPGVQDVSEEVEQTYSELKDTGQLDDLFAGMSPDQIRKTIRFRKMLWKRSAPVGSDLVWEFNNVNVTPGENLFVRFKYDVSVNPQDLQVYGGWEVGDDRQITLGTKVETPIYRTERKDLIRTFYEIEIPADCIASDGYVSLRFTNLPLNNTVVIFPPDGLELLYRTGGFNANYLRAVLLIFCRLAFLTCLATFAASFLSFPVAVLLSLAVFFVGSISGFILESFSTLGESVSYLYFYTIRYLITFLPRFDQMNPADYLITGRALSWWLLGRLFVVTVLLKAGVLLLMGLLIFSRREIAKIIV